MPVLDSSDFDHFAEHPDFYHMSTRVDAPGALPVIEEAASRMLGSASVRTRGLQLFQVQESDLFHGSCLFGNRLSALVYFSSIHMGMLAMVGEKDAMHYCKFTLDGSPARAAA